MALRLVIALSEYESYPKLSPRRRHLSPPPDDDIYRFDEPLDDLDCQVKANV